MKALVTGIAGFVGGHLAQYLRAEHPEVELYGMDRREDRDRQVPGAVRVFGADLTDASAVREVLAAVRPDVLFHLAAQSNPQASWAHPAATLHTNVHGTLHLLEGLRSLGLATRALVVGSSEQYGQVDPASLPLQETAPQRPLTPYAVSKAAQEMLAQQYARAGGVASVCTRTFHHTGAGRGSAFAESSFALQLAEIAAARREPVLEVGNLDAARDYTDVHDVVAAYWLLMARGETGEVYNVCSGRAVRLRDVVARLVALSGLDVEVRVDPARLRAADVPLIVGDCGKLQRATGWQPRVALDDTLSALLSYWRARLAEPAPQEPTRP